MDVSINLLIPVRLFNIDGKSVGLYLLYDATVN